MYHLTIELKQGFTYRVSAFFALALMVGVLFLCLDNELIRTNIYFIAKPATPYQEQYLIERTSDAQIILLKKLFWSVIVFILAVLFFFQKLLLHSFLTFYKEINYLVSRIARVMKADIKILFFPLFTYWALCLICLSELPIEQDEAYSILYYSSKNPLISLTLFNSTNNHIFFNFVGSILHYLPIDLLVLLRSVNILLGTVFLVFLYIVISRNFGNSIGIAVLWLVIASLPFLYYSVHARGYMMYLLFGSICIYYGMNSKFFKSSKAFVISAVLAVFTIPTFVYGLAGLLIVQPKRLFLSMIWVAGITLICYCPLFFVNGVDIVLRNEQVVQLSRSIDIQSYTIGFLDFWGNRYFFMLALIFLCIIVYKSTMSKKVISLFILLLFSPFLVPYIQGVEPPYRIFIYLLFPISFLFAAFFKEFDVFRYKYALLVFMISHAYIAYSNIDKIKNLDQFSYSIEQLKENIVNDPGNIFVIGHPRLRILLLYYFGENSGRIKYSRTHQSFHELNNLSEYDYIFSQEHIVLPGYLETKGYDYFQYRKEPTSNYYGSIN